MILSIISALCLFTGGLRFIEGGSKEEFPFTQKIPSGVWRAAIGLCTMTVAYLVSSQLALAAWVGCASAITIAIGWTRWELLWWQTLRGLIPCAIMIGVLMLLGWVWSWSSILAMCSLYVAAYVCYTIGFHVNLKAQKKYQDNLDEMPWYIKRWERVCRWIQGTCVCGAASLV